MSNTFLGAFAGNLLRVVFPLREAFQDVEKFKKLLSELGWDVTAIPSGYASVVTSVENLVTLFEHLSTSSTEEDILQLVEAIGDLYSLIKGFSATPPGIPSGLISTFLSEFPERLLDYLIIRYLQTYYPTISAFLESFSVITLSYVPASGGRPAYYRKAIDYSRLGDIITNPTQAIKDTILWGGLNYSFELISALILKLTAATGKGAQLLSFNPGTHLKYVNAFPALTYAGDSVLVNLVTLPIGDEFKTIDLSLMEAYGSDPAHSGLILALGLPDDLSLASQWGDFSFDINAAILSGNILACLLTPSGLTFKFPFSNTASFPSVGLDLGFKYAPDQPARIFGQPQGTRLELRNFAAGVEASYVNNDFGLAVDVDLSGLVLVIDAGQSDNFIKKILGDQPKEISFPLAIRWSSKDGISFKGSGSFEFNVNMHFKLGPIEFDDIKVSLRAPQGQDNVKVEIGTNIKGDLGVIAFNVDNIGLGLTLGMHQGNAGPFDIKLGFKPPTGIGIAIDASAVKGGGFLNYDEATWTYTGGLELSFSKISFSAIGIVSTKLPGGKPGYSLLIIISAEFTPIQLGMGFTLTGIGGILGLNRTMNPDVLRSGIRDNTLDSILFPHDIVKNANTIISNIGQAFPAKEGQFLVGPMAKIGWGTPTLLTIELGIIIELPEPVRLAILGVVKALLPSKDNAIVKIQVNFLGIIDFTNKYLSFDASLYDSQILTFGLFGDMALRLYWGDKPNFLLSVGGFHPKFTPPPLNLPELRRLTIVLANQDNLKISVETYFAVTSNSVQFGAKVAAMAKAWKIQAIGALWFDILFQFSPFHFMADMGVMFAIKMGSKTILSLYVDLSLEGPNPWRAKGKGSFKILFVKVSVSFDKTFGQAKVETIQAEAIDARVKAALTNRDNWEALLPDRSHELISWRAEDLSDPNAEISVDPAGALKISQRLLPLETTMAKFGSSAISDFKRYDITSVMAGTDTLPKQVVQDNFARNEFFYMTDDEKLSRPSYELFDSGVVVGSDRIDAQYAVHTKCHYEEITLDAGYRRPEPIYFIPANLFQLHRFGNYISRSGLSDFDRITTSVGPIKVKVDLQKEQFVLIDRNNMSEVSGYFSNSVDAQQFLTAQMAGVPATAANWIVANRFEL